MPFRLLSDLSLSTLLILSAEIGAVRGRCAHDQGHRRLRKSGVRLSVERLKLRLRVSLHRPDVSLHVPELLAERIEIPGQELATGE